MLWEVIFLKKQTQKELWTSVYLGVLIECIPMREGRKVGAAKEGELQWSHKGDLSQPHEDLWSWMACRVVSYGINGAGFCTPEWSSHWIYPGIRAIPRRVDAEWGSAVSCQPPALSAAKEMNDSVLKLRDPGGTPVFTIYSNMEFKFPMQKPAILISSINNETLLLTRMIEQNTWQYTFKG